MKKLRIQKIEKETFEKYGNFQSLTNLSQERLGPPPVEFFRDILQAELNYRNPSFSVTRVSPREMTAEKFEYHNFTGEAFMPLDGDVVIHVAPAGKKGAVPYDKIEAFLIPQHTLIVIKPGVWHAAPFAKENHTVHTLVVLPERTYANDCEVVLFSKEEKISLVD